MKTNRIKNKLLKTAICFLLVIVFVLSTELNKSHNNGFSRIKDDTIKPINNNSIEIRKFPYPYEAMLSITSDVDDSTLEKFEDYHRFLNTKEMTPHGQGLGLDIGDSFWMFMSNNHKLVVDTKKTGASGVMTYFMGTDTTKKHNADAIIKYFRDGWIDSIHTFGDFSRKNVKDITFNRRLAKKAWDEMNRVGIKPFVWINHGNEANAQNFGAFTPKGFMKYQEGDNPLSPYYHSDITIKNGIRFVWNSICKSNFGYDIPLFKIKLRDGQQVWGFNRYTNDIVNKKIEWNWNPLLLYKQLTQQHLDEIVRKHQYAIVGQHLGGLSTGMPYSEEKNIDSLRLLEMYQNNGKIIVARTSRLLNYCISYLYVKYEKRSENGKEIIDIKYINNPIFGKQEPTLDNIRGLTFYADYPENVIIMINSKKINSNEIQVNPSDSTGKKSIGIKWFQPDYTDYTKK